MPGGDGTGPLGAGPTSGRGMGACGQAGGWNSGRKPADCRSWRNRFFADWSVPASAQNPAMLNTQMDWLKNQLDVIQKRLEELTSR